MSEHIAKPYTYGSKSEADVRRDLVREMNRVGAYRLEGEYSGGHDEGGCDILTAFDKDGVQIVLAGDRYDHPLWQAVEDLLSTKFPTWALGVSVYGKVYVDLKLKRAWTVGEEETMEYREDTDPIDMRW